MEKKSAKYISPKIYSVYVDLEELLQNPGASKIQNGDDETPVPVTPGNPPGGIGAKSDIWADESWED